MTRYSAARITGAAAVGLLLASAMLHLGYYGSVTAHVTDDFRPVVATVWLACAINFVLVAVVVLALRPMDGVRPRLVLLVVALNPLSIGVLQILYHAPWPPAEPLLLAALAIVLTARFGTAKPQVSVASGLTSA